MDKTQVMEGLKTLSPWFHRIELTPFDMTTKEKSDFGEDADHPLPTWRHVRQCVPEDLSGKTVLDIGCNAGFYAFEARKRNAKEVLGVDARNWHVRQARFVQAALGLDRMRFRRKSLYELDPLHDGQWDLVLALGLVYHLKHLVLGLETLYKMTRETLILESAVAMPGMAAPVKVKANWLGKPQVLEGMQPVTREYGGVQKTFMPLLYIENDEFAMEAAENWFLPTPETLVSMLRDVGFSEVEVVDSFRDRTLIRAAKAEAVPDSTRPNWLRAEYTLENLQSQYLVGEAVKLVVRVTNREFSRWLSRGVDANGKGQVNLSAVLTHDEDPIFHRELPRTGIPCDISPGEHCTLTLSFQAPEHPGTYTLELDMVAEHVSFFQDLGSSPATVPIVVV